jgi:hypothetical protein
MNSDFLVNYYPGQLWCFEEFIDNTNATKGASGYWLSKKLYILSQSEDLTIAQYISNFAKYKVVTTEHWYKPKYDFILIDKSAPPAHQLHKQKTISKVGKPSAVFKCTHMEILYYKNGVSL